MSKNSARANAQTVTEWYQWLNKTYNRILRKPKKTMVLEELILEDELFESHGKNNLFHRIYRKKS